MAKKKRSKAKPKLKFKPKPAAVYRVESSTCAPEIKLAIWGIIALVVVVVLVMYFTGML
ncbi:hypothetical protein KY310_03890 [Candidatus Woesearchaeota archaeon]|nr:hypothetical protein [Candidatus Woesearchaeota archaeon]